MTTLAFYCGPGDYRDTITRQVTGSRYTHVEIVHPSGWCISASKRDGNQVRQKRITLKSGHWCLIYVPVCPARTWETARQYLGQPYDTLGAVLNGGFGLRVHRPGHWYCNELVAHCIGLPEPWPAHPGALFDVLTQTPPRLEGSGARKARASLS